MKHHLYTLLLVAAAGGLAMISCDERRHSTLYLSTTVTAVDRGRVEAVALYLYDSGDRLIGQQLGSLNGEFDLSGYVQYDSLRVVAWGNIDRNGLCVSADERSAERSTHRVMLADSLESFASHPLSRQPTDLFFGNAMVRLPHYVGDLTYGNNRYVGGGVTISRAVSSYTITARNVYRAFGDHPMGSYAIVVRHPHSGIDFSGRVVGGESYFVPSSIYDSLRDELSTGLTLALPTGDGQLAIELYTKKGELLYSSLSSSPSRGVRLDVGARYDILLDFATDVVIVTGVVGWDEEIVEQPFD